MCRSASLFAALASVLLAWPSFGESTVNASATVAAGSLALDGTGSASTHVVKVADLTITTDGQAGCTIRVFAGALGKSDGIQPIDLQLLVVPDGAPAPAVSDFTTPAGTTHSFSIPSAGTHQRDVYVRYTPRALQDPGSYNSLLTIDVTDN